jgi:hypothetical protein
MELFDLTRLSMDMIRYFQGDQRRVHHALKVHEFASLIGRLEGLSSEELVILEAAALLHDIGIPEAERKYSSSAGSYQELEGPPVAEEILKNYSLSLGAKERILFLIGHHHSYKCVDNGDYQILIEADFLVNMFEDSLNGDQIKAMDRKIFKTDTGRELLTSLSCPIK